MMLPSSLGIVRNTLKLATTTRNPTDNPDLPPAKTKDPGPWNLTISNSDNLPALPVPLSPSKNGLTLYKVMVASTAAR